MDTTGEQHLQIDHNIYKRRLNLEGAPIEDPKKTDLMDTKIDRKLENNVIIKIMILIIYNNNNSNNNKFFRLWKRQQYPHVDRATVLKMKLKI